MGRESHDKRQRERQRQERSAAKRARRDARIEAGESRDAVDTDVVMERFRILSEQFAAGAITRDRYDAQRFAIFNDLGLEATT
jgi:hypothetical protein